MECAPNKKSAIRRLFTTPMRAHALRTHDFGFKWRFHFTRLERLPVDLAEKRVRTNRVLGALRLNTAETS